MKKIIALCIVSAFLTASCETMDQHPGATTGAAVGAGVGGLVGVLAAPSGKGLEGAVIGAVIGGLAGGVIGHYAYDAQRSQADTNSTYGYTSRDASVRIESAIVTPKTVKPGGKIDTKATYAVLTTGSDAVRVRETREIWFDNAVWGKPEITVERKGGTYASDLPIIMPQDAKKGTYTVRYIVETDTSRDTRDATFRVN